MLTNEQENDIEKIFIELSNEHEFYMDLSSMLRTSNKELNKLTVPHTRELILYYLKSDKHSMFQDVAPVAFFIVLMMEHYNHVIREPFFAIFGPDSEIQNCINLRYWNALCHANDKYAAAVNWCEMDKHRFTNFNDIHQVRAHFFKKYLTIN